MKIKNIFLMGMVLTGLLAFSSCKDNDDNTGDPYLTFDNITGTINVAQAGITKAKRKSVTVRSNSYWKVALANPADSAWLHFFIDEGEDDGIIQYWVDANKTFDPREGKINLSTESGTVLNSLDIQQAAAVPVITITNGANGFTATPEGGELKIGVTSNITWTAALEPSVTWAHITATTADSVFIKLDKNDEDERTVNLTLTGTGAQSNVTATALITQKDESLIFSDNFDWLQEGEKKAYYEYPEVKFASWTEAEKAAGWTTFNDANVFGGLGYFKLGKTNQFGDFESPALTKLTKPTNVTVSFQAIGYVSSGGAKDNSVIKVAVIGPGEVSGDETGTVDVEGATYRCVRFVTTVFPNSSKVENGEDYDPWAQEASHFSFDIKGATAETKIMFVGGDVWGAAKGKNRVLLDNVMVVRAKK